MTSLFDGLPDIFIGTFGQAVILHPTTGNPVETSGIFNPRSVDELGMVQPGSVLHLKTADAQIIKDGDHIQIGDDWYFSRVERPDGKGMVPVRLEKTNAPSPD